MTGKSPTVTEARHYLGLALKAQRRFADLVQVREKVVQLTRPAMYGWVRYRAGYISVSRHDYYVRSIVDGRAGGHAGGRR